MSTMSILSLSCGWPDCDRFFGSEAARATHRKYTHGEGQGDPLGFPCRVSTCTASFGTAENRDEHMRDVHKPAKETAPVVPTSTPLPTRAEVRKPKGMLAGDEEPETPKPFPCEQPGCGASFERAAQLGTHRFSKHGVWLGLPTGPRRRALRAPDPEPDAPNGVVTIVVSPNTARLLLDAVLEMGDKVDLDLTDPASLRREADRIELEQAVKAAVVSA